MTYAPGTAPFVRLDTERGLMFAYPCDGLYFLIDPHKSHAVEFGDRMRRSLDSCAQWSVDPATWKVTAKESYVLRLDDHSISRLRDDDAVRSVHGE